MENEHNNAVPEEKKPGYPMHKRKYTPLYTIIVFLYGLLVKLLFFMKIEGRENVPKDRNCILMGNRTEKFISWARKSCLKTSSSAGRSVRFTAFRWIAATWT